MSRPIPSSSEALRAPGRRRLVFGGAIGLMLAVAALAVGSVPALSADRLLDEARAAGVVGERYDGYAMVRDSSAGADVRALVDEVNAKRRAVYEQRAASEGVSIDQVGRVYAQEIFQAAPSGTQFLTEGGEWVSK